MILTYQSSAADGTEQVVDYQGLVKRLNMPIGWVAPTKFAHDDIRASALTRDHLHDDVRGINAAFELIRRTRGRRWPTQPVTEDFCRVGGGGGQQSATSARPTEPLVQFSRKRLSMGVALLAVVFTHAGNQLQKVDQPVFTVEAGLR